MARNLRISIFFIYLVSGFFVANKPAVAVTPEDKTHCSGMTVDNVWSGAPAAFGAITTHDAVFIGYYNADRYITVAKVDLTTCGIERTVLGSLFHGWDSHNYITLAFDKQKRLHVGWPP